MELDAYRAEAEGFVSAINREYYLHFSGQRDSLEIEAIYDRHAGLFSRAAVEGLRATGNRDLLEFAVEGLIGRATKREAAELARREASLEVELDGRRMPFRQAAVAQAQEPDQERRAAIDAARNELTESELNPLLLEMLDRSRALCGELGWPSTRAMCEELSGIDLGLLEGQTSAFLRATEDRYETLVGPQLERQLGFGFERLRRSDLPAFIKAPALDPLFPEERLLGSLRETLIGLGIDVDGRPNVMLDTETRPKKSPRAFCSPVRVPHEVYLVIPRVGGREDFEALFHEAGHTEHYAHVDGAASFEDRYLGDNSVTEGFAFLLQHLTAEPGWLRSRLSVEDPEPVAAHERASKLVALRRYAAKLSYELLLHDDRAPLGEMRETYARLLSRAVHVDWPSATFIADVDPFFYAARYLRAWALETHLRRMLRERFGETWYDEREAGVFLTETWREGQRRDGDALLRELTGARLDFSALIADVAPAASYG